MQIKFIKEAAVIFLLAAVSGILYHSFSPNGLAIIYQPMEIAEDGIIDINILNQLLLQKKASLIDVRSASEYASGHIPDALNLPLKSPRNLKIEFVNNFGKDHVFILYCSNASCNQAERLASEFNLIGYQNTLIFSEGLEGWRESGMSIETNE